MSFSGLRKQFNKANQYLSETVGAAEPTKLDDQYNEMERKVDVTYELISALVASTNEYLQPNPATRARMAAMGAVSKVRGTTKSSPYPQTEGLLSETMYKYGTTLGDDSNLGKALKDCSEAYRQMADIKYQLEDVVKHNFLDPITHLQNNELKEVMHHRTKLKGHRLDYDCKKRRQTRDDELIQAEEKLEASKKLAEQSMYNVLSNDVEQISQLKALVEAQVDFHQQTLHVLEQLKNQLGEHVKESASKPFQDHVVKPVLSDRTPRSRSPVSDISAAAAGMHFDSSSGSAGTNAPPPAYTAPTSNGGGWATGTPSNNGPLPPKSATPEASSSNGTTKPTCKALYDFKAENPGELELKEGQIIELLSQIDENWYEGRVDGKSGFFPLTYVQVVVPLPK
uniref:SH3 domain-containing GRB2-like protein n=1 Tax=Panagrellus redivivus TaxID=6233 RepID=A0A7E4V4T6_PANRE